MRRARRRFDRDVGVKNPPELSPSESAWQTRGGMAVHINNVYPLVVSGVCSLKAAVGDVASIARIIAMTTSNSIKVKADPDGLALMPRWERSKKWLSHT